MPTGRDSHGRYCGSGKRSRAHELLIGVVCVGTVLRPVHAGQSPIKRERGARNGVNAAVSNNGLRSQIQAPLPLRPNQTTFDAIL